MVARPNDNLARLAVLGEMALTKTGAEVDAALDRIEQWLEAMDDTGRSAASAGDQ
jgi:hypothetical protein